MTAGLNVFTSNEQSHMQDVHSLFRTLKYLSLLAFFGLCGSVLRLYWILKKEEVIVQMGRVLRMISYATGLSLFLMLLFSLNFSWFFDTFHKAFFPHGNYTFPATALLIILFPEEFFRDFALKMLLHVFVISLALFFIGYSRNMLGRRT